MATSWWNLCDAAAFLPPLLEAVLQPFTGFSLGWLDLRALKVLRSAPWRGGALGDGPGALPPGFPSSCSMQGPAFLLCLACIEL